MQVFQTAGDPPSDGNTIRAIIGCTRKRRNALTKSVTVNKTDTTVLQAKNSPSSHPSEEK
jgi:hypothetical protein